VIVSRNPNRIIVKGRIRIQVNFKVKSRIRMRIRIGALESESGMKVSPETKIYKDQNHYGTTRTQLIPDPEHRVGIKKPTQ
jgi:hypothetical protein